MMNPIEISISQEKPFGKINMQVKSNVIRGYRAERKANMAKVFDEPWATTSKEWLVDGKNAQLPITSRWKIYNLLHCFHPDTYDNWRPVGGRKTDGEYYECYHDDHIVNPSSPNHYGRVVDNPILLPPLIDKHVFCFEDFAEINHQSCVMRLHTEYLHEQRKSIIEYSLRHDRFPDAEIFDRYREWVIYVLSTKGAIKGRAVPFRCEEIITASHFKDWVYIFRPPDTFEFENGPIQPCWRIVLHSRDKGNPTYL